MKRMVKAASVPLTDRQVAKINELKKAYDTVFDILDDKEFDEGGEFSVLLNNPDFYSEVEDELMYISNLG